MKLVAFVLSITVLAYALFALISGVLLLLHA